MFLFLLWDIIQNRSVILMMEKNLSFFKAISVFFQITIKFNLNIVQLINIFQSECFV